MTEKVVSLSGGLVLGMVVALFLGIGATQSISPSSHFEMPSIFQMTIAQNTHNTPAPASNTTPTVTVATPTNTDRGRITRIATLTETTDPVFETTTSTSQAAPKDWAVASTPKVSNPLQRANLQHTYIASNSQTSSATYASLELAAARQGSFTALIDNPHGRYFYNSEPPVVQGKPHTQGSPSVAHSNPGTGEESSPAVTHDEITKPNDNDSEDNNQSDLLVHHGRPQDSFDPDDHGGPSSGGGNISGPSQFDTGRQESSLQ